MKYTNNNVQIRITTSHQQHDYGPVSIKLSHLLGVYILWIIGLIISIILFIIELLYNINISN